MRPAALMRTGSGPIQSPLARQDAAAAGIITLLRSRGRSRSHLGGSSLSSSPPKSLRFRCSLSEACLVGSDDRITSPRAPPPNGIDEEEEEVVAVSDRRVLLGLGIWDEKWTAKVVPEEVEEVEEFSGGGNGNCKGKATGGSKNRGRGDRGDIGAYYQEMLKADPGNPLLLRNYAKFLHEVQGDVEGAEEYYGRAILASPGDGEVLSLYGNLIWEAHRDEGRAGDYLERAVEASPDDCYVLGSYAHFLWDAEEEEEEERISSTSPSTPPSLVKA